MKKHLLIAASLAATLMLAACPAETPNPAGPDAQPSAAPSSTPSAEPSMDPGTPDPQPSADPQPQPTMNPSEPEQPEIPVASSNPNAGSSLNSAVATQLPRFRYRFEIAGEGLGAIADYNSLQVVASGATVNIIEGGVAKNNVEISDVAVTPTSIAFTWLPPNGAPTDQDLIRIDYERAGEDRESTSVRLSVPGDGV